MTHPYATADYAASLSHVGEAVAVPEWGGHVLSRPIAGGDLRDATGPYPLAVIAPDADLAAGRARLAAAGLVSLVLVADDRLRPDLPALEAGFDTVRRFKSHFVYDRAQGPPAYDKHHRYEIRRANARVEVREIALGDHLDAWTALYGELSARHGLGGTHVFPLAHYELLSRMPGVRTFGAFLEGQLASAHIFVTHDGYAVSHLAATSPEGYRNGAAYAVNALAIEALDDCEAINFGGGAGGGDDPSDGLVRFKKGFANHIAASWLLSAVLDQAAYRELAAEFGDNGFFPAYRGPRKVERADEHQG